MRAVGSIVPYSSACWDGTGRPDLHDEDLQFCFTLIKVMVPLNNTQGDTNQAQRIAQTYLPGSAEVGYNFGSWVARSLYHARCGSA